MDPDSDRLRKVATVTSGMRALIGLAALFAPRVMVAVIGFPAAHDNPTTRLIGRLFGIREILVAGYTAAVVQEAPRQPMLYSANAALDGADALAGLLAFVAGGNRRAAFGVVTLASAFTATWIWCGRRTGELDAG